MPTNGEINERFGVYANLCCGAEIVISGGAWFPDCPKHPQLMTTWKRDEPILQAKHLSNENKTRHAAA